MGIKTYYDGHVVDSAMFWIRVGNQSVIHTVELHFNITLDR